MIKLLIVGLVIANLAFNVISNLSFKWSAASQEVSGFLWWQVVGNLAGLMTVIAFTLLLRHISLNLAFSITAGLGFIAVQVVGAWLVLHETITPLQWLGTSFITGGIVLVCLGR